MPKEATLEKPINTHIFEEGNAAFRDDFDSRPFAFGHSIGSDHPLFSKERLRRLLFNPAIKNSIYYNAGDISIDQRWDAVPERTKPVEEVFDSVDRAGAWILLRRVSEDPEYKLLLDDCLSEIKKLRGSAIDKDSGATEADIYITSPHRVTMYHVDPICNFLMQVSGEKKIHIFDRNDRDILPEEDLERFWSEDGYSIRYRPEFESRAEVFTMSPGKGVHIPVTSPHWLKNGDNISISLSINYFYKDKLRKNVYQANYHLRKMGMKPRPLGNSRFVDAMKGTAVAAGRAMSARMERVKAEN